MKTKFSYIYTWDIEGYSDGYAPFDNSINIEINSDYFIGAGKITEILKEIFPREYRLQLLDEDDREEKLIKGADSIFQKLESPNGSLEIIMKTQLYFLNFIYTKSSEPKDYITR